MKRLIASMSAILLLLTLVGCGAKLPDGVDTEALSRRAAEITENINARDFEAVEQWIRADAREKGLSAKALDEALGGYLDDFGAFVKVKSTQCFGSEDAETNEAYAAAVIKAEYENATVEYIYYFDVDLALVGLYLQ